MGGGAWPFLVGGVICLVNSDNERDLGLLNSYSESSVRVKGREVALAPAGAICFFGSLMNSWTTS